MTHLVQLTSDDVVELYRHMSGLHGSVLIDKQSAIEMQLAGEFLDKMNILDRDAFLENFATTIKEKMWLPFTPGDTSRSLLSQTRLCAHEHQHVIQFHRDPAFSVNYVCNPGFRSAAEAECYRCNMEVHHWATGTILDPSDLANNLKHYALGQPEIDFVQKMLELSSLTIMKNGIYNQASKEVIRFLQTRGYKGEVDL